MSMPPNVPPITVGRYAALASKAPWAAAVMVGHAVGEGLGVLEVVIDAVPERELPTEKEDVLEPVSVAVPDIIPDGEPEMDSVAVSVKLSEEVALAVELSVNVAVISCMRRAGNATRELAPATAIKTTNARNI